MKKRNDSILETIKPVIKEFKKVKASLKSKELYSSADVARLCKIVNLSTYLYMTFSKTEKQTKELRNALQDLYNIPEQVDALLTGREPFHASRPEEKEL